MSNILDPLSDSDESDRDEVYQPPRRVNLSNNSSNNPTSGNRKRQAKTISVLYKNNKKRRDQVLQDNYFTNKELESAETIFSHRSVLLLFTLFQCDEKSIE